MRLVLASLALATCAAFSTSGASSGSPKVAKVTPKVWLAVTTPDPMTVTNSTNFDIDFTWAPPCGVALQWSLWASAPGGLIWLNGGEFDTSAMTGSASLPLNIPATGTFYVRFGSGDLERWVTINVQ